MQEKKISVIIPCYNSETYLETCLDSLLNQTIGFENLEVIFINDASTDGTLELLYQYEHQHPQNIMVINYEQNRRQGYARNLGISYSSAPYFTCLDADDYVAPDMLEKMYDKMETGGYDYTICNYYRVIHGEPVIMEEEVQQEELHYTIRTEEERRKFLLTDTPFKAPAEPFTGVHLLWNIRLLTRRACCMRICCGSDCFVFMQRVCVLCQSGFIIM